MLRWLVAALLLFFPLAAAPDDTGERFEILLTNDDGYDAPGLQALHSALLAEGYDVEVIAPSRNRSGASASLTTHGTLTWRQVAPGLVAVDGTPADCVSLALTMLLDEPPDLILSGINFGQNVGSRTLSSGTVGAALTGVRLGVPSIAVSQTVDPNDVRGTERYFPQAAITTVALVRELLAANADPLLPSGIALNVNHPARSGADVQGVRLTHQGHSTLYAVVYERKGERIASMAFAPSTVPESLPDADTTALAEGYVSITPLDGSLTATGAFEKFRGLARALDAHTQSRAAPASPQAPR